MILTLDLIQAKRWLSAQRNLELMPVNLHQNYRNLKELLNHPEFHQGEHWHETHFEANEQVIKEGESGTDIFVVLQGTFMVCTDVKVTESRHLQSGLCELFDGEEFALSCYFNDAPHSATVKTLTPCELAVIDSSKLKRFLETRPDIGYCILFNWIEKLLPRLRLDNRRMSSIFSWGLKAHKIDAELE